MNGMPHVAHNEGLLPGCRAGPSGLEVMLVHAVARIMLDGYIEHIQVSWVKEGPRLAQVLLSKTSVDTCLRSASRDREMHVEFPGCKRRGPKKRQKCVDTEGGHRATKRKEHII